MQYLDTRLFISGQWRDATVGRTLPVVNPVNGVGIERLANAGCCDLRAAVVDAQKGFGAWRETPPAERAKAFRKAPELLHAGLIEVAQRLNAMVLR